MVHFFILFLFKLLVLVEEKKELHKNTEKRPCIRKNCTEQH